MPRSTAPAEEILETACALNLAYSRIGLGWFLDRIVIDAGEPKRFGECADTWQRELIAPMIPAIDDLAGLSTGYSGPRRFMHILARGHNKSSLEAWIAAFLLVASKRPVKGYVLAADRDQGRLVLQAVEDLLRLNPWLSSQIVITKNVITGPAGFIEVLPCDASSMMGLRGNFFIADEFVHWKNQKAWTALVTGLAKVRPCVFVAISNAGLQDSWQHQSFLAAQSKPKQWVTFYRKGILATWLDPLQLAEDRLHVPPSEAARLFDNEWIDPASEHDYLRRSELEACAALGEALGLIYRPRRQVDVNNYVAAIDYGPRRDRTALVVLHSSADKLVVIDRFDVWQGSSGKPIQITAVEDWIRDVRARFEPRMFVVDPYQLEGTIQWMQREGIPVEAFNCRGGAGNFELAQHLRALVVERRLAWYHGAGDLGDETLVDELSGLRVKRMPYGYRFDHENQKHDDRAVAIGMASLRARSFPADEGMIMPPPGLRRS